MGLWGMFESMMHPSNGNGGTSVGAGIAERPDVEAPPKPSGLPPLPTEPAAVPEPPAPASDRIVLTPRPRGSGPRFDLLFLGDTSFGESYQATREGRGEENILKTRAYDDAWSSMRGILAAADFSIANLETPLTNLETSPLEGTKSFIHWGDVVQTPLHLARHHISAVTVANNHGLDYGIAGLEDTLRALESQSIRLVGTGRTDAEADRPLLIDLAGGEVPLRIAIFASYLAPQRTRDAGQAPGAPEARISFLDPARVAEQIRALKAVDPELLPIAFPHWGPNYAWRSVRQRGAADRLIEAGIELVLGHGAHNLQQVQRRSGRWVAFELGNFVFNSPGRYTKAGAPPYSLIARLIVRPGPGGWSISVRLYPIVSDNRLTDYHPRFATEAEFADVCELLADLVADALGGHLALELREAQQHVQRQPAHAGRGVERLGHRDEGGACGVQPLDQLGEVGERAGQPVDLVDDDLVELAGLEVAHKPLQRRPLQRAAGEAAVVVAIRQQHPALGLLAGDEGGAGLALGIERVEVLLEPVLGRFAGVDAAADPRHLRSPRRKTADPTSGRR